MAQISAHENPPISLDEWIKMAADKNLFVTLEELARIPMGVEAEVLPLDYCRFQLLERPGEFPELAPGEPLDPQRFFAPMKNKFERLSDIQQVKLYVHRGDLVAKEMGPQLTAKLTFHDGAVCKSAGIQCTDGKSAASGSGDGYTRYVLWSKLKKAGMPRVYFASPARGQAAGEGSSAEGSTSEETPSEEEWTSAL